MHYSKQCSDATLYGAIVQFLVLPFISTMCYPGCVVSHTPENKILGNDQLSNKPIHAVRSIGRTSLYNVGNIDFKLQYERNAAPATIDPTIPNRERSIMPVYNVPKRQYADNKRERLIITMNIARNAIRIQLLPRHGGCIKPSVTGPSYRQMIFSFQT